MAPSLFLIRPIELSIEAPKDTETHVFLPRAAETVAWVFNPVGMKVLSGELPVPRPPSVPRRTLADLARHTSPAPMGSGRGDPSSETRGSLRDLASPEVDEVAVRVTAEMHGRRASIRETVAMHVARGAVEGVLRTAALPLNGNPLQDLTPEDWRLGAVVASRFFHGLISLNQPFAEVEGSLRTDKFVLRTDDLAHLAFVFVERASLTVFLARTPGEATRAAKPELARAPPPEGQATKIASTPMITPTGAPGRPSIAEVLAEDGRKRVAAENFSRPKTKRRFAEMLIEEFRKHESSRGVSIPTTKSFMATTAFKALWSEVIAR